MSNIKYILGHFADPDDLMHGIDKLQEGNVKIYDVFTPMPIHGIEDKLGIKRSRLGRVAFGFGLTGTITVGLGLLTPGTDTQSVCKNAPIANIDYSTPSLPDCSTNFQLPLGCFFQIVT